MAKLAQTRIACEAPTWLEVSSLAPVLTTAATRDTGLWFSRVAMRSPLDARLTTTGSEGRAERAVAALGAAWAALEAQRLNEERV